MSCGPGLTVTTIIGITTNPTALRTEHVVGVFLGQGLGMELRLVIRKVVVLLMDSLWKIISE